MTVPAFYPLEDTTDADALACRVQERLSTMFCREMYSRRVGRDWQSSYQVRMDLLTIEYLLSMNPTDELVEILVCWYNERYL